MKLLAILFAALVLSAGCTRQGDTGGSSTAPASTSGPSGTAPVTAGPRIVSTTPAATFILIQIGAADTIVGLSGFEGTDQLPESLQKLPPVGNYDRINYEALLQVRPTTMIMQIAPERMDPRLKQVVAEHHIELVNIHLDTLAELYTTAERLGVASGHEADAKRQITRAKASLAELSRRIAADVKLKPRVLYVVGVGNMMVAGAGTFIDETIAAAGGINAAADVNGQWPTLNAEVVAKLKPDVVILSQPGAPEQQPNDPRIAPWLRYPIPAAKSSRVYVLTDPNAQMATLEVVQTVSSMTHLLHPDLEETLDSGGTAPTRPQP